MKYTTLIIGDKLNLKSLIDEILKICKVYNCFGVKFEFNRENVKNAIEFLSNRKSALQPFKEDLKRYKKGEYEDWNIELGLDYVIRDIGYYMWRKQTIN